ncbi:MAG: NAD(P)-dependent oxidoreductase [Candidatus Azobacteroides sp.]|nr:NAD(P)-dependent oxidoreductase [Candidatus Azobacteroides sp.]
MKILITGASGFIGSFIVEEALNRGFEVWAGIRESSSREYLTDSRIRFIDLKYGNIKELTEQLQEFKEKNGKWDYIVHNAGATKCRKKSDFDTINYLYTKNFADALLTCGIQPAKFVLMSSLSAWGPVQENTMQPLSITDKPAPDTAYGKSKLKAERYIQQLPDFPYMILHPTGVYGPKEKDYYLMFKSVKQGIEFLVGYQPQYITFVYVKDLVKVIFAALESDLTNRSYFVSDGQTYTGTDFSLLIQQELGKKYVVRLKMPLPVVKAVSLISEKIASVSGKTSTLNSDKYNIFRQRNWKCDISNLKKDLHYLPEYDLRKGVAETTKWYKEQGWL